MKYIVTKRFKKTAICGPVNIPAMTGVEERGGCLYHNRKKLCMVTSENAHQYFARNDDGCGMERGKLTRSITNILSAKDGDYQNRWDKVWADPVCQAFRRPEHADHWLWNHAFYSADLDALNYIADLVGARR